MSLRDLAADACAPDGASSSSANPLAALARAALDAPPGLDHRAAAARPADPRRALLLSDHAPAHERFARGAAPPLPRRPLHGPPPPGAGLVDEFLAGGGAARRPHPPLPPLPAYFPRGYARTLARVPPPAADAATARFEAAFAAASGETPASAGYRWGERIRGAATRAGGASWEGWGVRERGGVGGNDALRERARVRAAEHFPGEGGAFQEARVEEFLREVEAGGGGGGGGLVVEDAGVEAMTADWEQQFSALSLAGRDVAGSMRERGEERMDRSALTSFSEALAALDGSGDWAAVGGHGTLEGLPVLDERDGGEHPLDSQTEVDSWVRQFAEGVDAEGGVVEESDTMFGDSYNADLYQYLGADPASVGYEFAPADGNQYAGFSAREALEEGLRLRNRGELSRAVQALEAAASAGNQLPKEQEAHAWFLLGTTHADCDDDERAIQAFLRCVDVESDVGSAARNQYRAGALLALGVCYTNELNMSRALDYLTEWLDSRAPPGLDSDVPLSEFLLGESSSAPRDEMQERHRLLLARLNKTAREDPGDVDVSIAMGVLYNISRQYELAADAMRMAVTLRPDDARLWNKLGATLANGNESDDALRAYRKAVDLSPNFIRAWVNVGTAYANRSNFDKAARYYLKALSMCGDGGGASAGAAVSRGAGPSTSARTPPVESDMVHVWGYLRTTLVAMQREDLLPLIGAGSTDAFKPYIPF